MARFSTSTSISFRSQEWSSIEPSNVSSTTSGWPVTLNVLSSRADRPSVFRLTSHPASRTAAATSVRTFMRTSGQ